jgi:cytochrome c-type biogenesis protein CcmH/NrfG
VRARTLVVVLVTVLAVYLVLVGWRGVVLVVEGLGEGDAVSVLLGLSVLVFPVVGALLVWREVQFGRDSAALADYLARRGELPADDLPRRQSGRVDKVAARSAFDGAYAAAQDRPDDPAGWYRLGLAYDDLGDRRHARQSVRRAIAVWRSGDTQGA